MSEEKFQELDQKTKRNSSSRRRPASRSADDILRIMTREKPSLQDEVEAQTDEKIDDTGETSSKSDTTTSGVGYRRGDLSPNQSDNSPTQPSPANPERAQDLHEATEKRIRAAVDLPRHKHKFLRIFAVENETDGMSVLRGLIDMLQEEEDIAPRLINRLKGGV